jgi:hypothetical protein
MTAKSPAPPSPGGKGRAAAEDRHFTHGTSGAMADTAPDGVPRRGDQRPDAPHSRPADRLSETDKHDQLGGKAAISEDRQEALLDEGVEESFPASDPPSVHRIT